SNACQYSTGQLPFAGHNALVVDNSYVPFSLSSTLDRVHWDHIFEDLEGQLAAEWEAERAVLDAESERLRIAKLSLRTRLRRLQALDPSILLTLSYGTRRAVRLPSAGADWVAVQSVDSLATLIIPVTSLMGIAMDHGALLDALEDSIAEADSLRERMSLGF